MEVSGQIHVLAALPPAKSPIVGLIRAGLKARERRKNPFPALAGDRTPIVQPVA
jgi:hypothetical protein